MFCSKLCDVCQGETVSYVLFTVVYHCQGETTLLCCSRLCATCQGEIVSYYVLFTVVCHLSERDCKLYVVNSFVKNGLGETVSYVLFTVVCHLSGTD